VIIASLPPPCFPVVGFRSGVARLFSPLEIAVDLILYIYEVKQILFGDDLLIHHITGEDLTAEDQALIRTGFYELIIDHDQTGWGTLYSRLCLWDVSTPMVFYRSTYYVVQALSDYPDIQRKGLVSIGDFRGSWKSSFLQIIKVIGESKEAVDKLPYHNATLHLIYDDPKVDTFIKGIRAVMSKEHQMRQRFHTGSNMEIEYALKAFGIDPSDSLDINSPTGPMSLSGVEEDIRRREKLDEEWRQSEAPYRDPSSREALFPNPQDIILGRNKKIASSWPGNMAYHALIGTNTNRYTSVDDEDRIAKTSIAIEILDIIHREYNARFLVRKDTIWEVMDDIEARKKVSQALRNFTREIRVYAS